MQKNYILFNKPWGVLSQFTPEHGSRCLDEFNLPKAVYPAGRLDKDSEGLLLLTDDGPFIQKFLLTHPRTYWVQVEGPPQPSDLEKLQRGVLLKDGKTRPCEAEFVDSSICIEERNPPIRFRKSIPTTWISLSLTEGKNRQVRRMTAAIGFPTLRLMRVGLGKYFLNAAQPEIAPGAWIQIEKNQII